LEKENITIDKTEFLFQIQSHPDYPALLSISDTLSFFNIDNGARRVEVSDIDLLPNRFIALLNEENKRPELYFLENNNDKFYYTKNKKLFKISKIELENRWANIIILIKKSENEVAKTNMNNWSWILPLLCFGLFSYALFQFNASIQSKSFLLFPLVGFLFSFAALKDLFGAKSELINNFCNITASTSCTTIVDSREWKIFEIVSFSDLSICFFTSQLFGLLLFLFTSNANAFFSIQQILLFCSVPVIVLSIYFQKFVEKKWCPICLAIIAVILLELFYLLVFLDLNFEIAIVSLLHYGFIFSSIVLIWFALKKLLTKQKELKEFQMKSNRFMRNYTNFKTVLKSKEKTELVHTPIILGNPESKTQITIITNPFCGHCKGAHEILNKILEKHSQDLQIKVIIKTDLSNENDENKLFYQNIMGIYLDKGSVVLSEALHHWFEAKNVKNWLRIYQKEGINELKIDAIYNMHYNWCVTNEFSFTPTIFVNGYEYPDSFERENLPNFIKELIEDFDE
jgi:glutaredoxin/uncharacterized membrane protein